jgi:hypothetical protein
MARKKKIKWIELEHPIEDPMENDVKIRWDSKSGAVQIKNLDTDSEWETIENDESIIGQITDEHLARKLAFYRLHYAIGSISWLQSQRCQIISTHNFTNLMKSTRC